MEAEGPGRASSDVRPYPPSWLDAIVGWIDRLPGPIWAAWSVWSEAAAAR